MDIYKKASKDGLRFTTVKGALTVEQLWSLSLTDLDKLAVSLDKTVKASGDKSYLETKSREDATAKLRFDLVLDVLTDKVKAKEIASKAADTRAKNARIDEIIARKNDEELEGLSIEKLEALRG